MGDVINFRRGEPSVEHHKEEESLKAEFLYWLDNSIMYQQLQKFVRLVHPSEVERKVIQINSNHETGTSERLINLLNKSRINRNFAPELFAIIKILKERFGIKI